MIAIVSSGCADSKALAGLQLRPELRKATVQMRLAYAAASQCLEIFAAGKFPQLGELGLVVGSSQGELETTKEYYRALGQQEIARPFLFQNSLHHSTAGFLSQTLKILGPAITVADNFFTGEAALDTGIALLEAEQCLFCLVLGVDVMVPDLEPGIRTLYPEDLQRGEGAGALLLTSEMGLTQLPLNGARAKIISFDQRRVREENKENSQLSGFYDSDAVEKIATQYANAEKISLPKPDGTFSEIFLEPIR